METYLNNFLQPMSENTRIAYRNNIEQLLNYINKPLNDITYGDLIDYREHFETQYSFNSMAQKVRSINSYFDYLYNEREVIDSNPTYNRNNEKFKPVKIRGMKERKQVYYPMETLHTLLEYTTNPRDKAVIALYATTGLRFSELANLTLEDYENKVTTIIAKGNKKKVVLFNDSACKYIDEYLKVRKESEYNNLFISNQGTPMRNESLNRTWKCIAKRAGFEHPELIHNHSFRHTAISEVLKRSDLETTRRFAGHSSATTTTRYIHSTDKEVMGVAMSLSI